MSFQDKHIALVRAVNNAKTQSEHDQASAVLDGFRIALEEMISNAGYFYLECDKYYLDLGVTRPMCCGVFLDWSPAK